MELEKDYTNAQPVFDDRASMMSYTSSVYGAGHGPISKKHSLVGAWLMKESQVGQDFTVGEMEVDSQNPGENYDDENGGMVFTYSHLGHLLHEGDYVMAFDLLNSNVNNDIYDTLKKKPDVLIVKKIHPSETRSLPHMSADQRGAVKANRRCWELQRLCDNVGDNSGDDGEEFDPAEADIALDDFMRDLEEDQELAKGILVRKGEDLINLHDLIGKMNLSDTNDKQMET